MLRILFLANSLLFHVGINFGGSRLSANVLITLATGLLLLIEGKRIRAFSFVSIFMFFFVVAYSLPVTLIGPCKDEIFRAMVSGGIFFLFFTTAFEVGRTASTEEWSNLESTAVTVLLIGMASIVVELLVPQLFPGTAEYRALGKYSGMFNEPSYLAMAMAPSLLILLNSGAKQKVRIGIASLLILLLFSRAATLIGVFGFYVIYSILFVWPFRIYAKVLLATMGIAIALVLVDYQNLVAPFVARFSGLFAGTEGGSEASSLVYLAGIEDAVANFLRTFGFGTGFNTMGCDPLPDNALRDFMVKNLVGLLNTRDGSFLVSKLVSEFGIFGLALIALFWRRLRKTEAGSKGGTETVQVIAGTVIASLLLAFLAISVVRSTGYFNGSVFLGIMALGGTFRAKRRLQHTE